MREILFDLLLFGSCGYALMYGRRDARIVAAVCLVASIATLIVVARYSGVETGVLLIDLLALAAFISVALTSDRFWPMWVSGLQMTATLGHILKAIHIELVPIAYAVALRFWAYPILIILIVATWRGRQRDLIPPVPVAI